MRLYLDQCLRSELVEFLRACRLHEKGISIGAMTILAHFDGKVIVPVEPVNLPVDTLLEVDVRSRPVSSPTSKSAGAAQLAALERIVARARHGLGIPAEALRREQMYGDDGR